MLPPVEFDLLAVRFSGGNNPNDGLAFPETMADDERPQPEAESEHDEPILVRRMIRVEISNGVFIIKYGLSLLKGDSVLSTVGAVLSFVPIKADSTHMYNVKLFVQPVKEVRLGEEWRGRPPRLRALMVRPGGRGIIFFVK